MMETSQAQASWLSLLPVLLVLLVLALLVWIVKTVRSAKKQESTLQDEKTDVRAWNWILRGIGLSLLVSIAFIVLTVLLGRSINSAAVAPFIPPLFTLLFIGWRRMMRMAPGSAEPAAQASRPNTWIWLLVAVGLFLFFWLASVNIVYVFYLALPALIIAAWYCARRQWRKEAYLAVGSAIAFPFVGIGLMVAMNVLSMYSSSYR
ncbi:putative membrane protein [Collimonas fungivorans]|uniref:Putative membrane protein n=1 Tax=Collimonas fungivorans TaxID=158899 RepID=A0A127P8D2_9BURK|nr:hypothetical protein [Collimonas fungivorans]AMO94079.1 putative membrane protein [Collimonas fungivorans]